jgi:broad specificity phosphatase PhoE
MRDEQRWPCTLWIARHGQSAGNVARDAAQAARALAIEYEMRDADVPLSELGLHQADALGAWFGAMDARSRPDVLLCSPYVRARQTLERVAAGMGADPACIVQDERLREREFGIFDGLTRLGVEDRYPDQARALTAIGKFYHRPPGGESWCDVILRLRSVMDTLALEYRHCRVLVVAHQVTVLCFRYLIEKMTEAQILAIDREGDVANCGVTEYALVDDPPPVGRLALQRYNFSAPVAAAGEPVTSQPDVPVGRK